MNPETFEIIVLGGGLVGLTVANLCAKAGFSVVVVESKQPNFDWDTTHFDCRCSAISRGSQQIFQSLEVWDHLESVRVSPYRQMVVWDALGFGEIVFDAAEVAEPDLGHIIENRVMIKALWSRVSEDPNITLLALKTPVAIEITADKAIIELSDKTILEAKLVIGADGANSWLRETIHIETVRHNYHQNALVATVTTELPHQEVAWQRFLPDGPLAFLPLSPSNTSSIVWTATPEKIGALLKLEVTAFCEALAHAFDYRLGKVLSLSERKSFALEMLHVKQYSKHRVVLIGDAAHVIHPLAGQGVNLGLYDAKKLMEVLSNANQQHQDIGNHLILRKYERSRKGHITAALMAMECFNKIFGSQSTPIVGARSIGLNFFNKMKILKRKIISEAMGI